MQAREPFYTGEHIHYVPAVEENQTEVEDDASKRVYPYHLTNSAFNLGVHFWMGGKYPGVSRRGWEIGINLGRHEFGFASEEMY